MSFASMLAHDVAIQTPTETANRYGGTDKTAWTSSTVKGWVSQRSGSEATDLREAQVSGWVLFLHPEATIDGKARVTWGGITFEVDGPANPAHRPSTGLHHYEVPLPVIDG